MKQKTLMVMASCAAILTLLGLILDSGRDSRSAWSRASEPIFPNLPGQVDTADTLVIESSMGTTTLTRSGEDWTVVERGGFPGRGDEVGRLLVALAEATRVEPLTSKPDLHGQLGLGGFEDEASPTVRLTARAGSDVLADVFIGNRRDHGIGEGWYVLDPGSDQVWAAQAKLRCPRQTSEWLQTEVLDIARDRIARVHLESAEGETLHLERRGPEGAGFDIQNLPQGREPKTLASAGTFLGSLAGLRITDVQVESAADFPAEGASTTTWWTRGGLWIRAQLAEQTDDKLLARLTFGYDPSSGPSIGDETALGPVPVPEGEEEKPLPTPAELQAEADALNASTLGWIFTLPSWKRASFVTTMEELLRPLVDETDAPEQGAPVIEVPAAEEEEPEEILEEETLEEEVIEEETLEEEVIEEETLEEEVIEEDGLEEEEEVDDGGR